MEKNRGLRRQVLLVPEHISHEAEVDLCRALGPTASRDAEVLSFQSLGSRVLAQASTLEAEVKKELANGGNAGAAALIGKRIAEKAKAAGVEKVAFDRSGFQYHGRIKALADAARENGLAF